MSGPPLLRDEIKILKESDLPSRSTPLPKDSVVDFLLLTVKSCEFMACHWYLDNPSKYHQTDLGIVYIGRIKMEDEEDEHKKLKIALMKCAMGSSGVGGSAMVVKNAVTILRPKGVFCVGFCGGMNVEKAKLGDVVASTMLIPYEPGKITKDGIQRRGPIVPLYKNLDDIMRHAGDGWKAPVKNIEEAGKVVTGAMLSGAKLLNDDEEREKLLKAFPNAIAIEMEGEGVYTAAHDLQIEWVVIKGVSDYADGTKADTKEWRPFASVMAASVVANLLSNSSIFEDWLHYGKTVAVAPKRPRTRSSSGSASSRGDKSMPAETLAVAPKKARTEPSSSSASNQDHKVKYGEVSDYDMERLAKDLGGDWEKLGRRLGVSRSDLTGLKRNMQEYSELSAKALEMLNKWIGIVGPSAATYQALYDNLCHEFVQRRDLAENICWE